MNMAKAPKNTTKDDGAPMPSALPDSVTLASQYGYYDDAGQLKIWHAGQEVTDSDQIEDLLERDAPLEPFTVPTI
jgi:hypothetical protein